MEEKSNVCIENTLEVMHGQPATSENISISSISDFDVESDNEIVPDTRQQCEPNLPREFSSIAIKDSTDITFGKKIHCHGPVTIKQVVVDKGGGENSKTGKFLKKFLRNRKVLCILIGVTIFLIIIVLIPTLIFGFENPFEEPLEEEDDDDDLPEYPVMGLEIVTRSEWRALPPLIVLTPLELPSVKVIIGDTDIDTTGNYCSTKSNCSKLVRFIQKAHMESQVIGDDIGFNFLVGGDGRVYEGRGWFKQGSHTYQHNKKSFGIWFIGTFDEVTPPEKQLTACDLLLEEGVRLGLLEENYKLYAYRQLRPHLDSPGDKLYEIIRTWPHWSQELPD